MHSLEQLRFETLPRRRHPEMEKATDPEIAEARARYSEALKNRQEEEHQGRWVDIT